MTPLLAASKPYIIHGYVYDTILGMCRFIQWSLLKVCLNKDPFHIWYIWYDIKIMIVWSFKVIGVPLKPWNEGSVFGRLYTDFLSEGLIFAYLQAHYGINTNQHLHYNTYNKLALNVLCINSSWITNVGGHWLLCLSKSSYQVVQLNEINFYIPPHSPLS